jgi:hypothetical protein
LFADEDNAVYQAAKRKLQALDRHIENTIKEQRFQEIQARLEAMKPHTTYRPRKRPAPQFAAPVSGDAEWSVVLAAVCRDSLAVHRNNCARFECVTGSEWSE